MRTRVGRVLLRSTIGTPLHWSPYCCGYSTTWAVLTYFRRSVKNLWANLQIEPQEGTYSKDLYRVLTRAGLGIELLPTPLTPKLVRERLALNRPIILMMRCGELESSCLHWVVIVGQHRGRYRLVDSRGRPSTLSWHRIPRKAQLFAFAVGEFKNQVGSMTFIRMGNRCSVAR